jgi:DNA polymerase-3 subunit epsilon
MKVLIFDTETSGLPTEKNPSIYATDKWPHILQLSYIVYDSETNNIVTVEDDYIKIDDDLKKKVKKFLIFLEICCQVKVFRFKKH